MNVKMPSIIPWEHIEQNLDPLVPVSGGFSDARRGIVTLPDGRKVFVKIGINEHTKGWASKEIRSYNFLQKNKFVHAPRLLSTNAEETGFAISPLLKEDGWDWSDSWTKERLDATLTATDALAALPTQPEDAELLKPVMSDANRGWTVLFTSREKQAFLETKLKPTGDEYILRNLEVQTEREYNFVFSRDVLVHGDIRADNCAWNQRTQKVMLVDWNWLELGDRRVDLSAFLVHVHKSGFDVLKDHSDRLNADGLHWIAGFWLNQASKPIWPGGPEKLRDLQLQSALTALRLAEVIG